MERCLLSYTQDSTGFFYNHNIVKRENTDKELIWFKDACIFSLMRLWAKRILYYATQNAMSFGFGW